MKACRGHVQEREQAPPGKPALRAVLQRLADCEPVDGVPGVPCVWRIRPQWRQKYSLPQELPPDLVRVLTPEMHTG